MIPLASATTIGQDVIFSPDSVSANYSYVQDTSVDNLTVSSNGIYINGDYFSAIPDSGVLTIEIYNFSTTGELYKQFNATNTRVDNVSFSIGGYSSGQNASLYLDTILNSTLIANSTGFITFEFNVTSETNITITTTDVIPPTISNPQPTNGTSLAYTTTSVTLGVTTDETSECRYNTTPGQDFTNMTAFTNTNSTTHNSTISVSSGNSYNYYIKCNDSSGNINTDDYHITFSVASTPEAPSGSGSTGYCGNGLCDLSENYLNCPEDCTFNEFTVIPDSIFFIIESGTSECEYISIYNNNEFELELDIRLICSPDDSCEWSYLNITPRIDSESGGTITINEYSNRSFDVCTAVPDGTASGDYLHYVDISGLGYSENISMQVSVYSTLGDFLKMTSMSVIGQASELSEEDIVFERVILGFECISYGTIIKIVSLFLILILIILYAYRREVKKRIHESKAKKSSRRNNP